MKISQHLIDDKYISVQKHPTEDLYIYNYTSRCQFDRVWNEETLMCRGLILDGEGNIVARSFKKFFNLEEQKDLPAEDFEVFEKWDGSLGILYWIGSTPYLATRGSFTSDQALRGTSILQNRYADKLSMALNDKWTYLFEIIYPENRIVVDYKGMENIVLLAAVNTFTGREVPYEKLLQYHGSDFPVVRRYDGFKDVTKIKEMMNQDNKEGFVIRFASGLRVKIKFDEYVRLHRILTQTNARHIWDELRNGGNLEDILDRVPDEFYSWVKETRDTLQDTYSGIEAMCQATYKDVKHLPTRKEQARVIFDRLDRESGAPGVVFNMLDRKDYSQAIWKMIRPAATLPFKEEI